MIPATERRSAPRHATVPNAAVVSFTIKCRPRMAGATLVNLSATGALLLMRERPVLNGAVAIGLEYPVRTPAIKATVVRITEGGEVGVRFDNRCNPTFFWTATRGLDFSAAPPARLTEETI
jgi:hypothetical protein